MPALLDCPYLVLAANLYKAALGNCAGVRLINAHQSLLTALRLYSDRSFPDCSKNANHVCVVREMNVITQQYFKMSFHRFPSDSSSYRAVYRYRQQARGMSATETFDALLKVVIIGDTSVGKTCLILRYTQDVFRANFLSTIGKCVATCCR